VSAVPGRLTLPSLNVVLISALKWGDKWASIKVESCISFSLSLSIHHFFASWHFPEFVILGK
jgi:hypothetical protein